MNSQEGGPPFTKDKNRRFCPYCGLAINDFYKMTKCPFHKCGKPLDHSLPDLPVGYQYCRTCKMGLIKADWLWCTLCHDITKLGVKWRRMVKMNEAEMERKMNELLSSTYSEPSVSQPKKSKQTDDSNENIFPADDSELLESASQTESQNGTPPATNSNSASPSSEAAGSSNKT